MINTPNKKNENDISIFYTSARTPSIPEEPQ
jgi:hypothetical protein